MMITKAELNKRVDYWRGKCVDQDSEIAALKRSLAEVERYAHVNEDMALALARSHEVIGGLSATISTLVGRIAR
jgi:hypothetical protein